MKGLAAENAVLKNLLAQTVQAYERERERKQAPEDARLASPTDLRSLERGGSDLPVSLPSPERARPAADDAAEEGVLRNLVAETTRVYELQAAELGVAREEIRLLLEGTGDAVISTDATAAIRELNPVAERLTGWRSLAAQGRPLVDVLQLVGADGQAVLLDVALCLLAGEVLRLPEGLVVERRDGNHSAAAGSVAPLFDAGGKVQGMLLLMRDLGEAPPPLLRDGY